MNKYSEISSETIERIHSHIQVAGIDSCWNWTSQVNEAGRPKITVEKKINGLRTVKTIMIQHFVLAENGIEVKVKIVDPTCGNKICCNPRHLQQRDFETRFWNNVEINDSGCWIWQGDIFENTGYGRIQIDKKSKLVHRVSYEQINGKIPDGLMVLHSQNCTSRLCINPDHLRVGTHDDNMKDMVSMSRSQHGSKNTNTILTESQVKEIKQKIKSRMIVYRAIAAEYGVSRQAIKDIALGRTWRWLE